MTLPTVLMLMVDCPEGGDLSGLIFQMRVQSGTKNSFHIYFPKTSSDGITRLTSEDFRGQFMDHYEMGMMDYNGSIETANDVVNLQLFDPQPLAKARENLLRRPLFKHERTAWKSRQENIEYFLSCRNRDFYFFEECVRFPSNGIIRLTVGLKLR